jgi:ferric-dicitrate binding protein FerR (iron transport regulator)
MDKNINKSDFLALVQDEAFINLVNASENPDKLLEELVKENPANSDSIRYAFEFIQVNLSDKTKLNSEDFNRILKNIQNSYRKKPYLRYLNFIPQLRIAAVILIILSIGSLVIYHQYAKDPLNQFAQSYAAEGNQAMIVLSDGSKQVLKNNESFIDYNSTEGEVLIKNNNVEEIIENKNDVKDAVLNQVVVPYGQSQKILLSDGTLVQLNAGSTLTFPATFSGKTREVYLKGEGFFEVHKNEKIPFIVTTDYIDIKVLGTTFNVSAYDDEHFASTVLVEGKVNVSQKNKMLANDEYTISPGQGCFYSVSDQKSVVNDVDVNNYILWRDGLYKFHDMPLIDIVRRVHKYYNLPIQIEDEKLANTLVSGKLVLSDDFSEVIQYLSKTMEGRYEKTKDGIYILKQ